MSDASSSAQPNAGNKSQPQQPVKTDSKSKVSLRPDESRPLDEIEEKMLKAIREKFGSRLDKIGYNTIIRFIRGFAKEVKREEKTLEMLDSCLKWREEAKADEIRVAKYPNEQQFREQWPTGFHGVGKNGHPILIERPGQCDPDKVFKQFTWDEIRNFHIQTMERLVELKENITKDSGELCYKHIVILDLDGIGLSHMGSKFYGPMKQLINIDQFFYPETLHVMVITNSSWVFKALWKICSPWIDPLTKQRIQWGKEALDKFVDKENIPQFLKGACKCKDKKCLTTPFISGNDVGTGSTTGDRKSVAQSTPVEKKDDKVPATTNSEGSQQASGSGAPSQPATNGTPAVTNGDGAMNGTGEKAGNASATSNGSAPGGPAHT